MVFAKYLKLLCFTTSILLSEQKPECKYHGTQHRDLICTSDEKNYTLKRGLVSDSNRTTNLVLRGCGISDIDVNAFDNLIHLKTLDLSENQLQTLELGVLDGTKGVTHINLSYNELDDLPLGIFDEKPNLEVLDLKGNKIVNIKLGLLDPLRKLIHLDVANNLLLGKDINPYIFDRSTQIRFMDFSKNVMIDSPYNLLHAFRAIDVLNLDKCLLKEVPSFVLRSNLNSMRHLTISTNLITNIDNPVTFVNLCNLEILNLADNLIESLHEDVFKILRQMKMIVLRSNRLRILPETLFRNLRNLRNVDLSHNFLEHIPTEAFRGTSLKNLNLSDNKFTYVQANFILELRNTGAFLNKFYFNQNPWQCACLNELLKEAKSYHVVYNTVDYDGVKPVCVTNEYFNCERQPEVNKYFTDLYDDIMNDRSK